MVKFCQHTALLTLNLFPGKCCNQDRAVRVWSLFLKLFSMGPYIHPHSLFQTGCKGYLGVNNRSEKLEQGEGSLSDSLGHLSFSSWEVADIPHHKLQAGGSSWTNFGAVNCGADQMLTYS